MYLSVEEFGYYILITRCLVNDFRDNDWQSLRNGVICETPINPKH